MGVSVESQEYAHRIEALRETSAAVKFISFEPLLAPIKGFPTQGIDWVIVGGESGPRARPMSAQWVVDIREECRCSGIPFFFKQWGGWNRKKSGRLLEGRVWDETPSRVELTNGEGSNGLLSP
jgi:protein gp37